MTEVSAGTSNAPVTVFRDCYVWELNPGDWQWEVWDDIRSGHRLGYGNESDFQKADAAMMAFVCRAGSPQQVKYRVAIGGPL